MTTKKVTFEIPQTLQYYFTPTKESYGEIRKAEIKNHNLPILQYWYNGNPIDPLKCLVTNQVGFMKFPDAVTGQEKQRFNIDYNHIRQYQDGNCRSGTSIDKSNYDPSAIVRGYRLDQHKHYLVEMMTTMTVNTLIHSFITQDSAKGHIVLTNFQKDWWPWGLKTKKNFNTFCKTYDLKIDYKKFIDHLSSIESPPVIESYNRGNLK